MKKILLLAFALISILKLNAQSQCGTDEYDAYLKRTNPQYTAERQKMEQEIYSILKDKQNNPNARIAQNDCQPGGVFTIPVVVHVIHKGEAIGTGFNISDAQIQGAIQGMNERWRRVIGDGVDLEIQFALAVRDTNNNVTNGITRYDGRVFPNYATNGSYTVGAPGASAVSIMDSTVWDRSKYINIWIVDLRDACGYATLGIPYSFFMAASCMYNNSGTLAHEMGHAFGLHHTFAGDGSGSGIDPSTQCPPNNDCLLDGDWVCDTPPHKKDECSTTSCATSGDLQNSFKNYMSYCSYSVERFTQGQKDRVRASLYSDNFWSLVMSDALVPVNTTLEVGITSLENYFGEPVCNGFTPRLRIKNCGNTAITNLKISTYVDGVLSSINNVNTNLLRNVIAIYNLSALNLTSSGKHNLKFVITEMNGSISDFFNSNNQLCKDILVRNTPINNLCLNVEDNNINSVLFGLDTIHNPRLADISGCSLIGNKAIKYDGSIFLYLNNSFYLPAINLDSVYSAYLVFDHAYKQGKVSSILTLSFFAIKGCDSLPYVIRGFSSSSLASVQGRDSINPWMPSNCSDWKKDSISLSGFTGVNNLLIKCMAYNYGNIYFSNQPLYIDNFCIHKRYRISATVNPISTGSVTYSNSGGIYDDGSIATITATPSYCKAFKNWTENGVVVSTNPSYTFTVNRNRNLIANFERAQYAIALSPDNVANGTVTGSGIFGCDTTITVKATPTSCYDFVKWTENGNTVSTSASYSFTVTTNRNLVANFTKKRFTVTASPDNISNGTVSGSGTYACDTITTVVATPTSCYTFTNWTENGNVVSNNSSYSFTVTTNRSLVANFVRKQFSIIVSNNPDGGTVSGGGNISCGTSATVRATPYSCYTFLNWTENGIPVSANTNYTFTVSASRNLVANFYKNRYTITVSPDNFANGSVSGSGTYGCDTIITVIAIPASCYTFTKWTENGNTVSTNPNYSFTASANRTLVANFTKNRYVISLSPNDASKGTVTGNGSYGCDTTATVKAKIKTGAVWQNWTENGNVVSTDSIYSFSASANRTLVANFTAATYTIAIATNIANAGILTGGGTITYGTNTSVAATPASCYTFKNWSENGTIVSTNANYIFTVSSNRNLVANFEPKRYNVALVANPTNGGTVFGAGNFACDSSLTVKAKIKTGYQFINWTDGSTIVSTDSNYTFLISGARSLKANFSLVTGIKQTTINEISKIYPNPANEILQIEIRSKQNTSFTLNIIDMKGSLLETKTINNSKGTINTSFDVSKLAKGNYLLNLYDEDGMASYKFVVQ